MEILIAALFTQFVSMIFQITRINLIFEKLIPVRWHISNLIYSCTYCMTWIYGTVGLWIYGYNFDRWYVYLVVISCAAMANKMLHRFIDDN